MKIEEQVCTWEQGQRLHQLGVKAPSYFTWMECLLSNDGNTFHKWWALCRPNTGEYDYVTDAKLPEGYEDVDEWETEREYAAYTVAELGEMLPEFYPSWRFPASDDEMWIATVICSPKPDGIDNIHTAHEFDRFGKTQAEALATLLISLLETETITIERINKRLQQ